MAKITATMRADMYARRSEGEDLGAIAESYGLKKMTVYQHLCRHYGLDAISPPKAANDNTPGRVTRYAAHNGGCSTLSGMRPATLVRIPTIDGPAPAVRVAA